MIAKLEIGNVRVFDDFGPWQFPLGRINVLCGTNSAGKSTILKCLLLLMQSQAESDSRSVSGQLRLTGSTVDLGNFKSLVSHQDVSRDITISLEMDDATATPVFRGLRSLSKRPATAGPEQEYTGYTVTAVFRFGVLPTKGPQPGTSQLSFDEPIHPSTWTSQAYLKQAGFTLRSEDDLSLTWDLVLRSDSLGKGEEPEYDIYIPTDYFGAIGGFNVMDLPAGQDTRGTKIEALVRGILPTGLWAPAKRKAQLEGEGQWTFFPLPPLINNVCMDIGRNLETKIHYLGPLRAPAKRFYLATSDATPAMDPAGEFLPYVLRDLGDQEIQYVPPGQSEPVAQRLRTAVNEWLYYLRTGIYPNHADRSSLHEIDFTSAKDVLLEFALQSPCEETHALADSGFGYSQILPIIVRGLIAEFDDTIAIEQPEVHLNPALQVRMSEFLASLARAGKSLIIETHSEHIVNALRVLAAEDRSGTLASECHIIYLDIEFGVPQVKQLNVEPNGTVPDWPRSFMGEAMRLSARLLKAQDRISPTRGH